MSDFLHHLLSPVAPQAAEHVHHHGDMAGMAVQVPTVDPVVATAVALGVGAVALWWLLRRLQPRRQASLGLRLSTATLVAVMLLALPLLSVHATHHADGNDDGRCAVSGIAHSFHGNVAATPPVLAPLITEAVPFPRYLRIDAERLPLAPIARGPPAVTAA